MKRIVMALAGGGGVPTVNRRMTAPCDVGIYAGRDLFLSDIHGPAT